MIVCHFSNICLQRIASEICANMWGCSGNGNGNFSSPSAIAIDSSSGNVYVADKGNSGIQIFVSR
jgi:hypothetical protein